MVDQHDVRLAVVSTAHAPVLQRLWQLYRHDLGEFRDSPPAPDGSYSTLEMPTFLGADPGRIGYLIWQDAHLAGFALVGGTHSSSFARSAGTASVAMPPPR